MFSCVQFYCAYKTAPALNSPIRTVSYWSPPPTAAVSILSNHANWFVHCLLPRKRYNELLVDSISTLLSSHFVLLFTSNWESTGGDLPDFRSPPVQMKRSSITEVYKWLHGLMECCKTASYGETRSGPIPASSLVFLILKLFYDLLSLRQTAAELLTTTTTCPFRFPANLSGHINCPIVGNLCNKRRRRDKEDNQYQFISSNQAQHQ